MPELNAKLFGTPAVSVDGREITLPYKKADALLYYLILKRKTTRSELIGLLYEDTDSATALKNLRHAIYTIRKAFAFDPFVPGQRSIVEFSADVEIACDVYDFERGDMLSAYHGEFLKDFNVSHSSAFDAWLSDQRNLYQSQYLHQLLAAEKEAYYAGKLDLAEKYGTEYIAIDPLEESAFSTLMQVYRDQKKFRKALGLYHTLCKNLSDEFSISPLKETSALYYQIVDAWNTSTYKLEVGSDQQLIGKDAVLHKLVSLCNGSRLESDKICALIQGKTGVGKTYLINYILHQYDFSGWAICQASCYQSEMNTVLAPWNTIMLQLIPKFESENIRIPDVYIKTAAGLFPCLSVECQHNFSGISRAQIISPRLRARCSFCRRSPKKCRCCSFWRTSTGSTTTAPTSFRCCCTACAARTSRSSARAATFCSPTPSRCSTTPCATSCSTCTISMPFHRRRQRASSTSTPRAGDRQPLPEHGGQWPLPRAAARLDARVEWAQKHPCQRGQHHSDAPRGPFVR